MMALLTALSKRKYPSEESNRPIRPRSPVSDLVNFLNIDFDSSAAWERWKKVCRSFSTEKIDRSDELRNARDLQSEIKNDLSPIADWRDIPSEYFAYDERWFHLCDKLNDMRFRRYWQVDIEALAQTKDFFIPKFKAWNLSNDDRENWYALIGYLLETGEIARLKKCSYCRSFFEARDLRNRFCKPKCKEDFHERTAAERMRKSREKKKKEEKRLTRKREKKRRDKVLEQKFKALVIEMEQGKRDSIVTKLGKGQYSVGWNKVLSWADQIKRGTAAREVLRTITKEDKSILDEFLLPPSL